MASVTRIEQRNGRQYIVFDDPEYQAYYDALFALGEPGSPTPFDVNSAADLSKLGIIGVHSNTGEEYLSHPLKFDPDRSVRNYSIDDPADPDKILELRTPAGREEFAQLEHTDPNRWAEEKRKVELHLTHKYMAQHIKKLMQGQVMLTDQEAGEYPKKLIVKRNSAGRMVAQFEGIPKNGSVDKKPVPPKEPSGWAKMWHRVSKRLFRDTMHDYEQRKARYERELAAYERNDAYRRAAEKEWPKYAEAAKAKREQQRQAWAEQNQAAFEQDVRNAEALVETFHTSVRDDLNRAFGNAKPSQTVAQMMDNITINGKTIKSILCERFSSKYNANDPIPNGYDTTLRHHLADVSQSTIEDIVSAALIKQARVEVFPVDEHHRLHTGAPEVWKRDLPATINGARVMREKAAQWLPELKAESKAAILKQVDESRKLIARRNLIANADLGSHSMEEATINPWLREHNLAKNTIPHNFTLSTDRIALTSHALAWLAVNTDLSPQDIFDPTKAPELKAKAGAEVCQHCVDGDVEWMMRLNAEGGIKLGKMIHAYMKANNIDARNKDMLYQPEHMWINAAALACYDLDQESTKMAVNLTARVGKEVAAQKLDEMNDTLAMRCKNAYAWLVTVSNGTTRAINGILGDHLALADNFTSIAAGELQASEGQKLIDKSPDMPDGMEAAQLTSIKAISAPEGAFDVIFRVGTQFKNLADRRQVAKWAYNGGVTKNFKLVDDDGFYEVKPKNPAAQKQISELAQVKPVVNQNTL